MGFNAKRFLKTRWVPREHDYPVPALKDFFDEGADTVWKVRGLTGHEVGRCQQAADKSAGLVELISKLAASSPTMQAEAIKDVMGLGKDTPQDIVKRLQMLIAGSVDPVCDQELAVKLCTTFPIEFYGLTNKITELTGLGHSPGK